MDAVARAVQRGNKWKDVTIVPIVIHGIAKTGGTEQKIMTCVNILNLIGIHLNGKNK